MESYGGNEMSENIWECECGQKGNSGKFCINCGKKKPEDVIPVKVEETAEAAPVVAVAPVAAVAETAAAEPAAEAIPVIEATPVQPAVSNAAAYNPAPVQQPYGSYAAPAQNLCYAQAQPKYDTSKSSPASLILGIFSIVCLLVQPLGAILAIIGLITSRKGGTAGKVLCILGLVFGIIFLLLDLFIASIIMTAK